MQVTEKPFDDQRVRRAIQICCDAAAYPELVYQGRGRWASTTTWRRSIPNISRSLR